MALVRRTLEHVRRVKPRIDRAKIDATTESDIRRLGGLAKKLPRTAVTFLIAVLAASDVGIPWTPLGVGGFYSKDEILAVAYERASLKCLDNLPTE